MKLICRLSALFPRRLKQAHRDLPFDAVYKGRPQNLKNSCASKRRYSGWDVEGQVPTKNKITDVSNQVKRGYWFLLNDTLLVYQEQSIVANGQVIHARQLKQGDTLVGEDGQDVTLTSLKRFRGKSIFYRLKISGNHTYFVNGILLHNASRFWVGGTGTWNAVLTTNWSGSSGGSGGSSVPGASDTVTHDASSGGGTCTIVAHSPSITSLTIGAFTGSLVSGANTITTSGALSISGSGTRTYDGTSTTVSCATWTATTTTNLTFTAPTSITQTGSTTFQGGGLTYNTLTMTGATVTLSGTNNFTTLTRTGTAALTNTWVIANNQTVSGTLTINANSAINRMFVSSTTFGTAKTLSAGTLVCTNVIDWQDITASGAATWTTGASGASLFGNALGCTGITFTSPTTQTWSGTSGGNWSANAWTTHVPLPQDTVAIASAFSASQTVTCDMPRLGADISWAGSSGSPTWSFGSVATALYGGLTLISGMTISGTQTTTFNARSSYTLTSATRTFTQAITAFGNTNKMILADDLITNGALTMGSGFTGAELDFAANNVNVTCASYSAVFGSTTTGGTGTMHITSTAAITVFGISGTTFTSVAMANSTLVIDNASANTRTIATNGSAGSNYGTITYTVAGSTGTLAFSNDFKAKTLNFSDVTNARTVTFAAGITATFVSTPVLTGISGKLMTFKSDTGGSPATVVGPDWRVGANSTNVSGNTGLSFVAGTAMDWLSIQDITATTVPRVPYRSSINQAVNRAGTY